ncbi:MAG: carboxypeptidase-like regulatory domain-containing protein [bacterium]|nr:carboxypeptidase-like regulatory domain-containing protein [bacterium]
MRDLRTHENCCDARMKRSGCRAAALALWILCAALVAAGGVTAQDRSGEIAVTVRDSAARPVAGAEVVAVGGDWHAGTTDAAGQVRLSVTPGTWEIAILHADLVVIPPVRSVTVRVGESRVMEFRALPRSARIKGTVRFHSDPPTALAVLSAAAYSSEAADGTRPVAVAPLAEDRSFSLAVPPGRWRVGLLEVPSGIAARDVVVEQGQESEVALEVDFRTLAGAVGLVFEAGLITERLGPAFSLTTVGLYAIESGGQHRIIATTQARANQTYSILAPLPPGTPVAVFAWRPGGTAVPTAVRTFAAAGSAAFADIRFVVNSGTLVGTVVDPNGRPVADAWVTAVSAVRFEEWMMWGKPVHAPGGAFRIRVPLGPVLVRAWRDPRRVGTPLRVSVGSTDPVTVRLEVP